MDLDFTAIIELEQYVRATQPLFWPVAAVAGAGLVAWGLRHLGKGLTQLGHGMAVSRPAPRKRRTRAEIRADKEAAAKAAAKGAPSRAAEFKAVMEEHPIASPKPDQPSLKTSKPSVTPPLPASLTTPKPDQPGVK